MIDVTKCCKCGQPEHHSFHDRRSNHHEDVHAFEPMPAPVRSRRSDTIAELVILAMIVAGLMIMWLT